MTRRSLAETDPGRLRGPGPPPDVDWRATRRLIREDAEVYAAWSPRFRATRPAWLRWVRLVLQTETFAASLRFRLQILLACLRIGPLRFRALASGLAALNRAFAGIHIGHDVRIGGGLYLGHGQLVIDGRTTLGRGVSLAPFVTIGLSNARGVPYGASGPRLGDEVYVGTGAKLLGPIRVGDRARIGANAVVLHDVPPDHTAVGAPARSFPTKPA